MLRNVEKRGVQAARNGPSLPPCVAKAEMSTADRLGSVQGKGRAGPGPAGEGRKPVGCVKLAMTHRSASRCVFATHPTCWRPGNVVCPQRSPGTCSPAPRPSPSAENWVSFSCSIPTLFVLSHSMPMINTTGKLASFWRFSLTASSLPSELLATMLSPHASRSTPQASRPTSGVRSCADPPRWVLPSTDRPGSREVLLPPRPLRTGRESCLSSSSSIH